MNGNIRRDPGTKTARADVWSAQLGGGYRLGMPTSAVSLVQRLMS